MKIRRNYKIGIAAAAVALLAYVSFLLTSNYLSQKDLEHTLLDRFRFESETRAAAVSYFFGERREDLGNLVSSREVSVFFENRALGMSTEYGLKQSLPPIRNLFASLIDRLRADGKSVYLQIVLLDEKGDLLVQAAEPGVARSLTPEKKKEASDARFGAGTVLAMDEDRSILVTRAFFFKGRRSGQIIAWINPGALSPYAAAPADHPDWTRSLVSKTKTVYVPPNSLDPGFPRALTDQPRRFTERLTGQQARNMIAMASAVSETPFLLVSRAPASAVVGGLEPGRLLAGMGILAIVLLGAGLALAGTMTRSVLLQSMLDASRMHARDAREKNAELEREIAERKQAESALRDSQDRYRTLVETSPDVIFTLSLQDGVVRSINPAFEKVTGWFRSEWIGRHFIDIIHPDDRAQVLEKYREAVAGAGVLRYDVRCLTRTGMSRIVELTTAPIFQNGVVSERLGIARDITERSVLEEQLRHGAKMQAVGQLAGGIAHDFNNILSVIIGACDVLLTDMHEDDPLRPKMQMVVNSAERGAQLTRNLLTFSRKQLVRTQAMDLNEIVLTAEPLIARLIREDIRFSVELSRERLLCMADATQMEQVLMNLAANARDAMAGGGRFTISAGRMTMDGAFRKEHGFGREGVYAVLRVEDTGAGMDDSTRQRIFEPFFTTKGVGKGTGLGLATVFGIVKQHNGYIDVTSEVGSGTVFLIYLPLIDGPSETLAPKPAAVRRLTGTETVLVAEDEPSVRAVITQVLTRAGYRVVEACDGEDAEAKFRARGDEIDLVLLDVIMPRRNGKQAYESIKRMRPSVKCMFMSGYTGDIISSSGISETEADFLQKPVAPPLLLMKVRELLGGSPIQ